MDGSFSLKPLSPSRGIFRQFLQRSFACLGCVNCIGEQLVEINYDLQLSGKGVACCLGGSVCLPVGLAPLSLSFSLPSPCHSLFISALAVAFKRCPGPKTVYGTEMKCFVLCRIVCGLPVCLVNKA